MGSKTYVNAVTERLLDTKNYQSTSVLAQKKYNTAQRSKLRPSMRDRTYSSYLIETQQQSLAVKLKRAYNFAKNTDRYTYGLPTSHISTDVTFDAEVAYENYLNKIEKGSVTLLRDRINSKNLYFFAWLELIN